MHIQLEVSIDTNLPDPQQVRATSRCRHFTEAIGKGEVKTKPEEMSNRAEKNQDIAN